MPFKYLFNKCYGYYLTNMKTTSKTYILIMDMCMLTYVLIMDMCMFFYGFYF